MSRSDSPLPLADFLDTPFSASLSTEALWSIAQSVLLSPPDRRTAEDLDAVVSWVCRNGHYRRVFPFRMTKQTLRDICKSAQLIIMNPGTLVYRQRQCGDSLYVILQGCCDVFFQMGGVIDDTTAPGAAGGIRQRRMGLRVQRLLAGETFGSLCSWDGEMRRRTETVIASGDPFADSVQPTRLVMIPGVAFHTHLRPMFLPPIKALERHTGLLQRLRLFRDWPQEEVSFVAQFMRSRTYRYKTDVIYDSFSNVDGVYFLLSGTVRVLRQMGGLNGPYRTMEIITSPGVFGEGEVLTGQPFRKFRCVPADADPVVALVLPVEMFKTIMLSSMATEVHSTERILQLLHERRINWSECRRAVLRTTPDKPHMEMSPVFDELLLAAQCKYVPCACCGMVGHTSNACRLLQRSVVRRLASKLRVALPAGSLPSPTGPPTPTAASAPVTPSGGPPSPRRGSTPYSSAVDAAAAASLQRRRSLVIAPSGMSPRLAPGNSLLSPRSTMPSMQLEAPFSPTSPPFMTLSPMSPASPGMPGPSSPRLTVSALTHMVVCINRTLTLIQVLARRQIRKIRPSRRSVLPLLGEAEDLVFDMDDEKSADSESDDGDLMGGLNRPSSLGLKSIGSSGSGLSSKRLTSFSRRGGSGQPAGLSTAAVSVQPPGQATLLLNRVQSGVVQPSNVATGARRHSRSKAVSFHDMSFLKGDNRLGPTRARDPPVSALNMDDIPDSPIGAPATAAKPGTTATGTANAAGNGTKPAAPASSGSGPPAKLLPSDSLSRLVSSVTAPRGVTVSAVGTPPPSVVIPPPPTGGSAFDDPPGASRPLSSSNAASLAARRAGGSAAASGAGSSLTPGARSTTLTPTRRAARTSLFGLTTPQPWTGKQ